MTQPDFITADTVAQLVGLSSAASLHAQRDRLEAENGFPLPMPTSRRPLLWRRVEIAAWVDRQGLPKAFIPQIPVGSNVRLLRMARAE